MKFEPYGRSRVTSTSVAGHASSTKQLKPRSASESGNMAAKVHVNCDGAARSRRGVLERPRRSWPL